MRELYGMGLTFRVLALGVKSTSLYRNITARLLIGTLWTGFLRGADAGCATQENDRRHKTSQKTKSAA